MADTTVARPARETSSQLSPQAVPDVLAASVARVSGAQPAPSSSAARSPRPSLRTQLILVVLAAAIVPLALLALWLARASGRAGEALLTARLDAAVLSAANEAVAHFEHARDLIREGSAAGPEFTKQVRRLSRQLIRAYELAGRPGQASAVNEELASLVRGKM